MERVLVNMRKTGKDYLEAERQKQPENSKTLKGKSVTNVTK
jgi:hypothetical protein